MTVFVAVSSYTGYVYGVFDNKDDAVTTAEFMEEQGFPMVLVCERTLNMFQRWT